MYFQLPGARVNHPGQGMARIELPANATGKLPVVIAVHGSGRSAPDYWDTPFYSRQRELALSHGCLFAAVSNAQDTWGLDDGLYNVKLLTDYVAANYPVADRFVYWATSAGGVCTHRLAQICPEKVALVIGTFPVYDLAREFKVLASCGKAWGTQEESEFLQRIAGKNPPQFREKLQNIPYFISHGDCDQAVPLEDHSLRLAQQLPDNVRLEIIPGGDHGTGDFRYLETLPATALKTYLKML